MSERLVECAPGTEVLAIIEGTDKSETFWSAYKQLLNFVIKIK